MSNISTTVAAINDHDAGPTGLNERNIPPELLPQARAWFDRQLIQLEKAHGPHWPAHRDWLVDYLNEELRERVANREVQHGL